jgi:hypothetical protein
MALHVDNVRSSQSGRLWVAPQPQQRCGEKQSVVQKLPSASTRPMAMAK